MLPLSGSEAGDPVFVLVRSGRTLPENGFALPLEVGVPGKGKGAKSSYMLLFAPHLRPSASDIALHLVVLGLGDLAACIALVEDV